MRLRGLRAARDPDGQRFVSSGRMVRLAYGGLVLAAVLGLAYWAAKPLIFLKGPGTVEAPAQDVSYPHLAEVKIMAVRPGQEVHRGTVLAVLSRPDAVPARQALEQRLFAAEARLRELENRLLVVRAARGAADQRVGIARAALARIEQADRQFVNANYVATMQREYAQAADRAGALAADAATVPAALATARVEIEALRKELALIERSWSHIQLTSRFHGAVGPRVLAEGSTVVPGQTVMSIYDESRKFVLWRLPAFSLAEPRRGDAVQVAYGRARFAGKVSRVLSLSETGENGGRLVEIELSRGAERLPLGVVTTVSLSYFNRR